MRNEIIMNREWIGTHCKKKNSFVSFARTILEMTIYDNYIGDRSRIFIYRKILSILTECFFERLNPNEALILFHLFSFKFEITKMT